MLVSWLGFTAAAGKMHLFGGLRVGLKDAVGRMPRFLAPIPFHNASLNNADFPPSKKLRADGRDCKTFYDLFSEGQLADGLHCIVFSKEVSQGCSYRKQGCILWSSCQEVCKLTICYHVSGQRVMFLSIWFGNFLQRRVAGSWEVNQKIFCYEVITLRHILV